MSYHQKVALNVNTITEIQIRILYLRNILIIFLPINLNMCFGCSKEPSSFEYPQHMFLKRNKEAPPGGGGGSVLP